MIKYRKFKSRARQSGLKQAAVPTAASAATNTRIEFRKGKGKQRIIIICRGFKPDGKRKWSESTMKEKRHPSFLNKMQRRYLVFDRQSSLVKASIFLIEIKDFSQKRKILM